MSNLGGNSPSADTDKSNNLKGDKGDPGADSTVPGPAGADSTVPGPAGNDGVVQTVVGGTNTTVDATDPANPIINVAASTSPTTTKGDIIARGTSEDERVAVGTNGQVLVADSAESAGVKFADAAAGDPLTTKGDVIGFDTDANRIPVGTNDQVLTADSTNAFGIAWKDAAAGGGGVELKDSADFTGVKPANGFWLAGEQAASASTHGDGSITPEEVSFDFIYFSEATTTIDKIAVANDTASNGGSIMIGLHPVDERGKIGAQLFVGIITISTTIDTTWEQTVNWVVPQGHYAIAVANNTAVNLTNIISATSGNSTGSGFGKTVTAGALFKSDSANEQEFRSLVLFQDDYITSGGDLTGIDFTDVTKFVDSPSVNGDLTMNLAVAIVIFQVASSTPVTQGLATTTPLLFKYESQVANLAVSTSGNATKGQWLTVGPNKLTVFNVSAGLKMAATSVYRMFIAKEAATANEVEVVVATSESLSVGSVAMVDEGFCNFTFTSTFELEAGARYFFGVQVTHGINTTQCNIILSNGAAFGSVDFTLDAYRVLALNTIPAPGFDIGETGTNFVMPMQVNYIRSDLPQVAITDPDFKPPLASIFPLTHLADNTFTDEARGLVIAHTGSGVLDDVLSRLKTVPSGDWTLTARFDVNMPAKNFDSMGIVLHDEAANKSLMFRFIGNDTFAVGVTRYIADNFSLHVVLGTPIPTTVNWMRVVRTASGYSFELSSDGIIFWVLTTTGLTTHGTVDQIGMFLNPQATAKISMVCTYWDDPDDPAS